MARGVWIHQSTSRLEPDEKKAITAACERLIAEVLLPKHLPEVRPTEFNYPVGIAGKWRGTKYRFVTRYRSGMPHHKGEEFDAPFTRLEWTARNRLDMSWHRHTGEWWPVEHDLTLKQALNKTAQGGLLAPPI